MADVQEDVVEILEDRAETMRLDEFVRLVETHHRTDEPGVSRELLADYAEAVYFDVDPSALDERLTDSDEWESGEHLYRLGDGDDERISEYPRAWHETVGDTDDVRDVIETIQESVTESEGTVQESVTDEGVPEEKIYRVGKAVADIDEDEARDQIKQLRENDEIEEFASQHRNPRLRLR